MRSERSPTDRRAGQQPSAPVADSNSENPNSRRLSVLHRRRQDALFDVEQSELAAEPENPWVERITLLTAALESVKADRKALDARPSIPTEALPATPIRELVARDDDFIDLSFSIGSEAFHYREETDWDERGGPLIRGDLRRQAGDPAILIPLEISGDLRQLLAAHLDSSLDVFATDLRDRTLAQEPLPTNATLADLAMPCPECRGWRDWRDRCTECARRDLRRQELRQEANRLEDERTAEANERSRLIERLPTARRRLAAIETDIAALEGGQSNDERSG